MDRRFFLKSGSLYLAGLGVSSGALANQAKDEAASVVKVGMMADIHYAEKDPMNTRFYRESLSKFHKAIAYYNQSKPDFVVELGDLIDQADNPETEVTWLETIDRAYGKLQCPRHYVLGNHCVTQLTKFEFASLTRASVRSFYKIEKSGVSFLVLDACFREDGASYSRNNFDWRDSSIPALERKWLKHQLAVIKGPIVVFMHQRADEGGVYQIKNAALIRKMLEDSKKVCAVFQGHSHKNDYQEINGIHYVTLAGMVEGRGLESNSYSELQVLSDGGLKLSGFYQQKSYDLLK